MKTLYIKHPSFFLLFIVVLISCADNSVKLSDNSASKRKVALAYKHSEKGDYYYKVTQLDSAFFYYNSAKQIFVAQKDSANATYSLLMLARIQRLISDYNGSETSANEALQYVGKNNAYKREAYNILGMCYRKNLNYEDALTAYRKAIIITPDSLSKSIIQNNIATVYNEMGKPKAALALLHKLKQSDAVLKDSVTYARVINNLGLCYQKINNPEAEAYLKKAHAIREAINDRVGLLSSYLAISQYYAGNNKLLTKQYALKALELADSMESPDEKLSAIKTIIETGDAPQTFTKQYIRISDSLHAARATAKNQFAKIKYDSKVVQLENLKLKTQKQQLQIEAERSKTHKVILAIIILFTITISLLIMKLLRVKFKRNTLKEVYNTESRISKQIHDEVANDVFNIMSFAENTDLSASINRNKFMYYLENVYNKVRDISHNNADIEAGPDFPVYLRELLSGFQSPVTNVILKGIDEIAWDSIDDIKKVNIYRILQELMVNMKKHSKASLVAVTFTRQKRGIHINYADNGIGMDINHKINGLANVENRNRAIGGHVIFDSQNNNGCRISLYIPV